jgi:hypothetical protein
MLPIATTGQTVPTALKSETKTADGIKPDLQAVLLVAVTQGQFVQSHDFRHWKSVYWSIKYEGGMLEWLFVLEQ